MMDELKEFSKVGTKSKDKKPGYHREKHLYGNPMPGFFAARPVKRNDYVGDADAMAAYWKEWMNLEKRKVWRWETLTEWDVVSAEARRNGEEIHLGFLFGLMVEKGSEFPEGDVRRYYKYRIVFRGNDVKDQNWEVAMFQEMATTPTTLEASRYSDLLSCFPGNSVEGRDVEQAYLQADMEGTPTYIVLPKELWTPEMFKMRCPVFRLEKALYGHKNPGAFWQRFCNEKCLKADSNLFQTIGPVPIGTTLLSSFS